VSKPNKVNKDHYVQKGRLTPDEMARERSRQAEVSGRGRVKEQVIGKTPARGGPGSSRPRSAPEE
jgi:hypothetical protein